jgi:hypothetical protein
MGITEIFSTSFLICLAICLILIGALFMYFNQKLNEQNHKITSMFDLVSTMAEEVNSAKQYVQLVMNKVGLPMNTPMPILMNNNVNSQPALYNGGSINKENSNLIAISEDEHEDEEDEDEDEEEDDEEDEEDDDEDDDEDDEESSESEDEDDKEDESKNEDDTDNESYSGLNFEMVANEAEELDVSDIKNLKTININFKSENLENDQENDQDNEPENDIEIESEDLTDLNVKNVEVLDYKKLSLNKLRSIVTEKGIITDASKLKKNDLLKLLEVE